MVQIRFATSAQARPGFGLPPARLKNLYAEATPGGPTEAACLPRPGLTLAYTVGEGPDRGRFQRDGVFGGAMFAVSGDTVYMEQTAIGRVPLGGPARFAASERQLVVAAGGEAWCYQIKETVANSTVVGQRVTRTPSFARVELPDGKAVSDVFCLAGRFYYLIAGDDLWYWSALGDAEDIDGLAFATAESQPDAAVAGVAMGGQAVLFGRASTEFWIQSGDPDAPLVRASGQTYARGCASQSSIAPIDGTVLFVGDDLKVYRAAGVPERVSNHTVEQMLRACTARDAISAFACSVDGHDLYVLTAPGQGTMAFDLTTGAWAEWASHGRSHFRGSTCAMVGATAFIGDAVSGRVFRLDPEASTDGGEPLERTVSAFVQAQGSIDCSSVALVCGVDRAPETDEAVAELRYSDDDGRTWSDWEPRGLGRLGDYGARPRWTRLGRIRGGRLFEFRVTDPVRVSFAAALLNEDAA